MSFGARHRHYRSLDFWPLVELAELITEDKLRTYSQYFESAAYRGNYALVGEAGVEALKSEWPQIAREFGLS